MIDGADLLHDAFLSSVASGTLPEVSPAPLPPDLPLLALFKSQLLSRHLDYCSRRLQQRGESFYTIGSAGHEGMAAVAAAFRPDDMAFLHYRDAAFFIQRAKQLPNQHPMRDLLLSFTASSDDPIAGGRHKVLGSKSLFIPPQTSTIASHLPKAVGTAASIGIARSGGHQGALRDDGVILCSFGDASLNHSTAQGAINTAAWMAYQGMHVPIVFICEDNGIGISVPTPEGWVAACMQSKPGITYLRCNGLNLIDTYQMAKKTADHARGRRAPVFLHMECVRLMGHAGSDVQSSYLSDAQIAEMNAKDPLLHSARLLLDHRILTSEDIITLYQQIAKEVEEEAARAITRPKLSSANDVMASIVPPARSVPPRPSNNTLPPMADADKALPMVRLLNMALHELMHDHPQMVLAGEDIGKKGGVYGVTKKLLQRFGKHRVIDTLLDEQSILGLAIGMAHNQLLPIVEIQFLAYLHNAEDQLRGEAATLSFFSKGQFTNPMIVRIAGLAYQKGFGGHFHNDNSIAVLRDIPGIIVACPSNGANAVAMLRECVRLCEEEQRVVIFLEPIALYGTRDLHEQGDQGWSDCYQDARTTTIPFQQIRHYGTGHDLCILTYGNGTYLSCQAMKLLADEHDIYCTVIDLCWLHPLPEQAILDAIETFSYILMVDECRQTGSISEGLLTLLARAQHQSFQIARLCAKDSFIPIGKASTLTLPSKETIVEAACALLGQDI